MDVTRRDLLALMGTAGTLSLCDDAAAQTAAASAPGLASIVERNDAAVRTLLQSQITDTVSANRGSVPDQFGLHSAGSASGVAETLAASYAHPQSAFHHDSALLDRIRLAAGFLERVQGPQGNIDLLTTNFNSPPDTGFVVHNVATAAAIGRRHGTEEIARTLNTCRCAEPSRGCPGRACTSPGIRRTIARCSSSAHKDSSAVDDAQIISAAR